MINNSKKKKENIIFRQATTEDVSQIVTVNLETWQSAYGNFMSPGLLARRTKDRHTMEAKYIELIKKYGQIYVAEANDNVIGYISYGPSEMEEYKTYGEVYTLYILKEYQRRGYGSKMLKMALEHLKQQGYVDIVVTCLWENIDGINFYKKCGGKIVKNTTYNVYEQQFKDTIIVYNTSELPNSKTI